MLRRQRASAKRDVMIKGPGLEVVLCHSENAFATTRENNGPGEWERMFSITLVRETDNELQILILGLVIVSMHKYGQAISIRSQNNERR